jgi:UTP--glucose-1-phosphate uridylyltransferase
MCHINGCCFFVGVVMQGLVKKAVFPVAGYGTRFLPATKAYPKEMLPIIDKPLIQYAAEEAIAAGCTELIFVTSHAKKAIEDHFDRNIALEQHLFQRQEFALINVIKKIIPSHVTCVYVRQPNQLGLGDAVACASSLIKDEPFAVILADDLIASKNKANCLAQLIAKYEATGSSVVAVEKIADEDLSNYGVVKFAAAVAKDGGYIDAIVEKPGFVMAPSNYAVAGRYVLTPTIFNHLKNQAIPESGSEIQLTDALQSLLFTEQIYALIFDGVRYDCGKKTGYIRAIFEQAMQDPEYQAVLKDVMEKFACV